MRLQTLCASMTIFALAGCASNWQHTSIKDKAVADRQFIIDDGYCTRVANGTVPMPEILPHQMPTTSTVTLTGNSYNTTTGQRSYQTYSGQVTTSPVENFASGFASGASIGAAIRARLDQDRVHKECMFIRGWTDKPTSHSSDQPIIPATVSTKVEVQDRTANLKPANDIAIYSSLDEEWHADVAEFMQLYPAYRTGPLYDLLNDKVKSLAITNSSWTGPKILLEAHRYLEANGQAAPEPEHSKAMVELFADAVNGNPAAQSTFGSMRYAGNESVEVDTRRAAFWLQKSAIGGDSYGQMLYGLLMFSGDGMQKNRVEGYQWIQKSAITNPDAKEILQDLQGKLTDEELRLIR